MIQKLVELAQNDFLPMLLSLVFADTALLAIVLSLFQLDPEIIHNLEGLREVLRIFEG